MLWQGETTWKETHVKEEREKRRGEKRRGERLKITRAKKNIYIVCQNDGVAVKERFSLLANISHAVILLTDK
jgi:hypothetical protein